LSPTTKALADSCSFVVVQADQCDGAAGTTLATATSRVWRVPAASNTAS